MRAPIEAEGELVEVSLQMLRADAVINACEAGLQVREDEMDNGQKLLATSGSPHSVIGVVIITAFSQADVAAPIVRHSGRPLCNDVLDNSASHSALRSGATASLTRPA